jgi:hypothetical protein
VYHRIKFISQFRADPPRAPLHLLERVVIRKGTRLRARVWSYVVEAEGGPTEVADLLFADGTSAVGVRCACFSFVG